MKKTEAQRSVPASLVVALLTITVSVTGCQFFSGGVARSIREKPPR